MPPTGPPDPGTGADDDRNPRAAPQQSQAADPPSPCWPLGDPRIVGHGPASRSRLALLRRLNAHRPPLPTSPGPIAALLSQVTAASASAALASPTVAAAVAMTATPMAPGVPTALVLGTGYPYSDEGGMLVPLYVVVEEEETMGAMGSTAAAVRRWFVMHGVGLPHRAD